MVTQAQRQQFKGSGCQLDVIPYVLCLWWIVYYDETPRDMCFEGSPTRLIAGGRVTSRLDLSLIGQVIIFTRNLIYDIS
jgi:hypothetical protein